MSKESTWTELMVDNVLEDVVRGLDLGLTKDQAMAQTKRSCRASNAVWIKVLEALDGLEGQEDCSLWAKEFMGADVRHYATVSR